MTSMKIVFRDATKFPVSISEVESYELTGNFAIIETKSRARNDTLKILAFPADLIEVIEIFNESTDG